jgi:putative aldouronate transport system substrate-binding protein
MSKAKTATLTGSARKRRRSLLIILAVLIVLIVIALIMLLPKKAAETNPTIKVAAPHNVIAYLDTQSNGNSVTAVLEELAGVKIEWMDYGESALYERVGQDASASVENRPDAYLGFGLTKQQINTIAPDVFLNISNLVFSETTTLKQIINEDTSRLPDMQTGGQLYSYPTFAENFSAEYPQKVWINKAWLDELNLQVPTTPEELYSVLAPFKARDMNGNGEQDEIPLGVAYNGVSDSGFGFIVNAFVTSDYDLSDTANYFNLDNDGKVYTAVTRPQYADALKFIQRLFREQLVSPDAFELGREAFLKGSSVEEIYGVVATPDLMTAFNDAARASVFVPLPPLDGGNLATVVHRSPIGQGGYMVAIDTQNYKTALALGDAMLTMKGTLSIMYGLEGEGWAYADNRIGSLGGTETTWRLLNAPTSTVPDTLPHWMSATLAMSRQAVPEADGTTVNLQNSQNWQGYLNKVTRETYEPVGRTVLRNILPELVLTQQQEDTLNAIGNVRNKIYGTIVETSRRLVTTDASIDAEFPLFTQELDGYGLQTLMSMLQEAYMLKVN